ncbi:multi-copper polyphenol laccase, putative [Babesia ovata]|uniref:Multi-copper polyphenol laccase, putative n=1 Tax=Babesia ovata TaxID=189622 RepID=A0A2H6KKH4_9APIC|nr:multi-copper polyphenol laccase, putative [Babesia ovata]GBE63482.1 multi-copper polyphenol laccase, putative [Babesia ovata]
MQILSQFVGECGEQRFEGINVLLLGVVDKFLFSALTLSFNAFFENTDGLSFGCGDEGEKFEFTRCATSILLADLFLQNLANGLLDVVLKLDCLLVGGTVGVVGIGCFVEIAAIAGFKKCRFKSSVHIGSHFERGVDVLCIALRSAFGDEPPEVGGSLPGFGNKLIEGVFDAIGKKHDGTGFLIRHYNILSTLNSRSYFFSKRFCLSTLLKFGTK